jgi:hypothetical protein
LLVFCFQRRLRAKPGKHPPTTARDAGSSKERAMLIGLIIIAVLVFAGLEIGRRLRRRHL